MKNTSRLPNLDPEIIALWREQMPLAVTMPNLPAGMRERDQLVPRFAAYYTYLRALPRRVRRALQRQWHLPLAGVALMLALGQSPRLAATIPVNASCTLVNAITAANTDTATGGCPAGSGADTIVLPVGSTQTLTSVHNSTHGPTGLPMISSVLTIVRQGSTITRASGAPPFRLLAVTGELTLQETTVSGGAVGAGAVGASEGGGVYNIGTLTVTNSTISGNYAHFRGGGVSNFGSGTLIVTNSTISGNSASVDAGGVANSSYYGTLTITNSTISGNSASFSGGGVRNSGGTLILARTLVSGNTADTGPEMFNDVTHGNVVADNHNLFGVNGTAGVVGFSPGTTDLVPPAGVQLSNILNPVLAFNGGPTETHALVPGSPAIDAGGPVCLDPNGNPLLTDQRGKPRIVDGNGDGTSRCDIGAFEFFPVVNNFVTLAPGLDTAFDSTPVPGGPAGTFTIGATFTNTSSTALRFPFFTVTELSKDNLLLNADEGTQGVGATVTPNVGDQVLSPGETVQVNFIIGLQAPTPFTFFVDLFGEPLVSGSSTVRQRPNVSTKGVRR